MDPREREHYWRRIEEEEAARRNRGSRRRCVDFDNFRDLPETSGTDRSADVPNLDILGQLRNPDADEANQRAIPREAMRLVREPFLRLARGTVLDLHEQKPTQRSGDESEVFQKKNEEFKELARRLIIAENDKIVLEDWQIERLANLFGPVLATFNSG